MRFAEKVDRIPMSGPYPGFQGEGIPRIGTVT
jgi:hypothetical protein